MNILSKTALFLTLSSALLMAKPLYLSEAKLKEIAGSSKVFYQSSIKILEGIDEENTYFLNILYRGKPSYCFVDKKSGEVYLGRRYDKAGKASVFVPSPKRIAKLTKVIQEGVSFSYGTGKKEVYLFTDPQCGYCKKFEKQAEGLLDDYTVHVILFPLRFHKKAPAMIEWAMAGTDDKEKHTRLQAVMIKDDINYKKFLPKENENMKYSPKIQESVDKALKAANALNVTGTPTIFDASFKKLNWGKFLKQERAKKNGYKPFKKTL